MSAFFFSALLADLIGMSIAVLIFYSVRALVRGLRQRRSVRKHAREVMKRQDETFRRLAQ